MKLKPLDDRVVVEPLTAEEKTAGGIVLPDTAKEKPRRGKVLAVGPGRLLRRTSPDRCCRWRRSPFRQVRDGNRSRQERNQDPSRIGHSREGCCLVRFSGGESSMFRWKRTGDFETSIAMAIDISNPQSHFCNRSPVVAKQLLFEDRARIKLLHGVETLAKAVAVTMGPTGRNVIIDKSFLAIQW